MHIPSLRVWTSVAALSVLCSVTADASNVRYMNLRDLVARADRIVRGTVVASEEGTVQAGGGAIPVVTYRIRVEQTFKGEASAGETIDVKLLGRAKQSTGTSVRRGPVFRDLPQFAIGGDYLFVLTRPSAIGLSTTVGLGQGLFQVRGRRGNEFAVNEANNLGLFSGLAAASQPSGPVSYAELVKADSNPGGALRRPDMTLHCRIARVFSFIGSFIALSLVVGVSAVYASGPIAACKPGEPFRWPNGGTNIPWNPDRERSGP